MPIAVLRRAGLALILTLAAAPAFAEAVPVFSDTGPDAAAFGAAEGYPVGTRATLNEQGHMVGAYSHYDELLPTRAVPKATAPQPFARAEAELTLSYSYAGATHTLADYLERHPVTGLLVVKDHTILFEHYRYARKDTERFTSQSMAKTVLAMLIGIAIDEGKIHSIDDSAAIYVPELAGTELGRTPIRALLQMASGLAFNEVYNGRDDMARMSHALLRRDSAGAPAALREFDHRVAPPDTVFHYASVNSELLGLVLTNATRMQPSEYLATRIWQRIGTEADAAWVTDATGQELTYCCLQATLRDWARFGVLLAQDGTWDNQPLIPRQWLLDATTLAAHSFLAPSGRRTLGYGYGTWIEPGPRRQFALLGVHGQTILVDPASRLVLVHTAVRPMAARDPLAAELPALWNALVAQESH